MPKILDSKEQGEADTKLYVGIDPGIKGAIAVLQGKEIESYRLNGTPREVHSIVKYIRGRVRVEGGYACLERIIPRPMRFFNSKSKKWECTILMPTVKLFGHYKMMQSYLIAERIPFKLVLPQTWQKWIGIEHRKKGEKEHKWKGRLKSKAVELYQSEYIVLDNADAILIAHYCKLLKGIKNVE